MLLKRYVAVLSGILILSGTGCGQAKVPDRAHVTGYVRFGAGPLEHGRVEFIPVEENQGPSAVAMVTDGFFELDQHEGPVVGKNRVQIEALPCLSFELDDEAAYAQAVTQGKGRPVIPPQPIPPEYNQYSTLVVTVSRQGDRIFDFQIDRSARHTGR